MGKTEPVTWRVPHDVLVFIDKLVANGRYPSRADFLNEAALELKSQFTGEPTMRALDGRVKLLEYTVGHQGRNLTKMMEELKIEPIK
jgi:Arc/MetJ-type ribon-helix-helix transcriptional regulator